MSCYELFCENGPHHLRESILRRSTCEAIGGAVLESEQRLMYLMPDIVDDFDSVFRSQLSYQGKPLFQVPRSIALACFPRLSKEHVPQEFLCLDYDGEEFYAIRICGIRPGSGGQIFVRMGREKFERKYPSYRTLAREYLNSYQKI